MRLFNTLTRQKEELIVRDGRVRMYACGPTVYNYIHIGNARCFVLFDMLRRYLEYRGNDVVFVQNFTDVDDKMIAKAKAEGCTVPEIAARYIDAYFADARGLGVRPEVEEGGSRILTVTPDEGYTLTMITVNGLERTADAEGRLALDGILEDMTIEIAFERESGSNAVYYIMIAAIVLVFAAAGYFFYRKRA